MKSGTFDRFTKALAAPVSRRRAFRWGAVLAVSTAGAGTALGLEAGTAHATGSSYDCIYFCRSVFPAGSNRNQCLSDAASGSGLCYSGGPASSGGSKSICCPTNSAGQCTSYSSTAVCSSSQTCVSGSCTSSCSGTTLLNGTCAQSCSSSCSCGTCVSDLVTSSYCTNNQGSLTLCVTDLTCSKGEFCNNLLGVGVCQTAISC